MSAEIGKPHFEVLVGFVQLANSYIMILLCFVQCFQCVVLLFLEFTRRFFCFSCFLRDHIKIDRAEIDHEAYLVSFALGFFGL